MSAEVSFRAGVLDVERLRERLRAFEFALRDEDALIAIGQDLRCLYWGRRMEALSGLSADRLLGRYMVDVFPAMRESGQDAQVYSALSGRAVSTTGRRFQFPQTGRTGLYEARYVPWTDDDGVVVAALVVMRDLTEEHRVRCSLEETEARFRNMANHSPVMLWMSGTDGLCTFFNETWLAFTGRSLEAELGVGWAEGVHPEDFQRCMDHYLEAFCERRVFEMEYRLQRADGEWRWILDRGTPRWTADKEFAGYIGSCVDITDHKRLESELRKAVRDRDDFLSIASHELRTPLTTVQLALDTVVQALRARKEPPDVSRLAATAMRASTQAKRLALLVEELLDVSWLAAKELVLERAPADLAAIAHDVVGRVSEEAVAVGCAIDLDAPEPARGSWDRARIERVLVNLVSNAFKYGRGRPVRIEVSASGEKATVRVTDQGIGIASADQARIFERFERAVSSAHYSGFGLGLWIAREIVRAHDGEIHVSSQPGEGATFQVTLPQTRSEPPAPSLSRNLGEGD